jgi:hypothetical protein
VVSRNGDGSRSEFYLLTLYIIGIMIECIRGTGGCNGWVHPACCGLVLTQEELEALDSYICPMCEKPSDDYSKMKAMNTALANQTALKERNKKKKKKKHGIVAVVD